MNRFTVTLTLVLAVLFSGCQGLKRSSEIPIRVSEVPGFVFVGDTGSGDQIQLGVAKAMETFCASHQCDFALLLGDNFYPSGVTGTNDKKWMTHFETPYQRLDLVFHAVLGNHDYGGNIQAQIDYTKQSKKWFMGGRFYQFEKHDAGFFGIDSHRFDADQQRWLKANLSKSKNPWKIVFGHHPVYSYGDHGKTPQLVSELLPLLESESVDFYLCGHDHDLQVIQMKKSPVFVVAGGGGARVRPVKSGSGTLFARSANGFGFLQLQESSAVLSLIDSSGNAIFQKELLKPQPTK